MHSLYDCWIREARRVDDLEPCCRVRRSELRSGICQQAAMSTWSLVLFSFLAFFSSITGGDETQDDSDIPIVEGTGGTVRFTEEDDVLVLNSNNFDLAVVSKDIILVEFYAPWCGHCKNLAPEYAKAAKLLKEEEPPIPLAKIDATAETDLAAKYEVTGYPTLFIFRKGQKFSYDGPRTALGIVEYMKQQADPNWKPPPETVITLSNENFTDTVNNAEIILVEFYAPWCGHCKKLAPEFERAAKQLAERYPPIPLAKIDGTAEKDLANAYDISGWPTLLIFRKGRKYKYEGPRDEHGIVSHMIEQSSSPSTAVVSIKSLEINMKGNDPVVVGYFTSSEDSLFKEYIEAGNELRGKFNFYHTFEQNTRKYFGASEGTVVLYQPEIFHSEYEPPKYTFSKQDGTSSEILKFLNDNALPLVGQRTRVNMWRYIEKVPLVAVYYDVDFSFDHKVQTQLIRKEVLKAAVQYKGQITFCISDEAEFSDELTDLGLDDSGEDVNAGFFKSRRLRYRLEPTDEFSAEVLKEFVDDVQEGKILHHIRSQPVPRSTKGLVTVVVGSTFDDLVTNNKKDVLLEFYAPWCPHCNKFEPVYKKLAKHYVDKKELVIAKIDGSNNDFPEQYEIQGYPTIYFIPASNKDNVILYTGERNLEELIKFVDKQYSKSDSDSPKSSEARDEL